MPLPSTRLIKNIMLTMVQLRNLAQQRHKGRLPFVKLMVLEQVVQESSPTIKDIAAYLQMTLPSAGALIDDLQALHLISRKVDRDDRRVTRIMITSKGKTLLQQERRFMEQHLRQDLAGLSLAEQKTFFMIIQKIYQHATAKE